MPAQAIATKEADDAGKDRSDDHDEPLPPQVLDLQPLIDRVGLDEAEAPGREGRPQGRRRDEHSVLVEGLGRDEQAAPRGSPVRVGHEPGHNVGQEHGGQRHQDVFDPMEAAAQDEDRDHARRDGHGDGAGDPEQFQPGGYTRILGAGRSDVRDQQRSEGGGRRTDAEPLPYQADGRWVRHPANRAIRRGGVSDP